ncbi:MULTISPECIES: hypothetical protein [unclassified Mycobacterium]|uniref:hypothetical protein n=1 Tax=unclassified Mycobacterium TaxID=2642494 RepID=UPI00048FD2DE|nr:MULTISPECIES: hypothetical protein [unclassified Mycobacterium]SEB02580.1 hypothetical protein SAMN04488580_106105 [Mycobacterium sp. 283mftsu]
MKPLLDRVDFRPDQLLSGDDLVQASRRTSDLMALHAARVHGVWGVARGYLCAVSNRRDKAIVVGSGVGVDHCGRLVLNAEDRELPLPSVPVNGSAFMVDLVARYSATAELPESCGRDSMPTEQAQFRWEHAGFVGGGVPPYSPAIRLGIDIPIARVTIGGDRGPVVETRSRPTAHALIRPKIATGRILQATRATEGVYADWKMLVDTRSAGFDSNAKPVYLVSLDAHPFGDTASFPTNAGPPPDLVDRMQKWRGPYVSIRNSSATTFLMRVLASTDGGWGRDAVTEVNPVPMSWVGIDTFGGGPFAAAAFLQKMRLAEVNP